MLAREVGKPIATRPCPGETPAGPSREALLHHSQEISRLQLFMNLNHAASDAAHRPSIGQPDRLRNPLLTALKAPLRSLPASRSRA
jgi:hypothetical protein